MRKYRPNYWLVAFLGLVLALAVACAAVFAQAGFMAPEVGTKVAAGIFVSISAFAAAFFAWGICAELRGLWREEKPVPPWLISGKEVDPYY